MYYSPDIGCILYKTTTYRICLPSQPRYLVDDYEIVEYGAWPGHCCVSAYT